MKLPIALASLLLAALPAAQASTMSFAAALGPEAFGATGSGSVFIVYDDIAQTLAIDATWAGLSGTTTVAHIHCCTAAAGTATIGVAVTPGTLPGFPDGTTAGTYSTVLDLTQSTTYTASFITNFGGGTVFGAEAALIQGLGNGRAYFNIHSNPNYPGGEIRGFTTAVPEPATAALLLAGLAGVGALARRRAA